MSLANYPALPQESLKSCEWTPVERQTQQFSRNGSGPVIELGKPYWEISCQYENLTEIGFRSLTAFLNGLRGAKTPFKAYRPSRPKSITRPDVDADNIETLNRATTTNYDALFLVINEGEGSLGPGDMIAYRTSANKRYVGEVTGIETQFLRAARMFMFPPVETEHGTTPEAQIVKPEGLFTLMPETLQMSEPYDPKKRVSFKARQYERAYA